MNVTSLIGLLTAILVIVFAALSSGADAAVFWNPAGLLIVLGGTAAAVLLSFEGSDLRSLLRVVGVVFSKPREQAQEDAQDFMEIARQWSQADLIELSSRIDRVKSPFFRIGLKLLLDGMTSTQTIVETLQWRIEALREREKAEAAVFYAMASYAPAFGMLGTLFGLINMLRNTDTENLAAMTSGMAVALITTLYGILLANMVFKPIAMKFEKRTASRVMRLSLILEGLCTMSQTKSAAVMRELSSALLTQLDDELGDEPPSDRTGNW